MTQDITVQVGEILAAHQGREGALLPILHDIQAAFGHVPQSILPQIAKALNISKAEVHGVVTFYHDFREEKAGAHVVKLCRAEACQAVGADKVADHAKAALGVDWHGTTADGQRDAGAGVLSGSVRLRSGCDGGWQAGWPGRYGTG